MSNPTPFFWLQHDPAEVAALYLDVFEDSEQLSIVPGASGPMGVTLRIKSLELIVFNAGEFVEPTAATSLMVSCADQAEIDRYWERLGDRGSFQNCGWLTDRFGVTWQIIPDNLTDLVGGPDTEAAARATQAMLSMDKLVKAELEAAYAGS